MTIFSSNNESVFSIAASTDRIRTRKSEGHNCTVLLKLLKQRLISMLLLFFILYVSVRETYSHAYDLHGTVTIVFAKVFGLPLRFLWFGLAFGNVLQLYNFVNFGSLYML